MNQFILAGLVCVLAANYIQIIEEWSTRGLTDTSYKTLLILITGSLLVANGLFELNQVFASAGFVGSAALSLIMVLWKLRDLSQTRMKSLR